MIVVGLSKLHSIEQAEHVAVYSWYLEFAEFEGDLDEIQRRYPNCRVYNSTQIDFFVMNKKIRISTELNFAAGVMLVREIAKHAS